MRKASNKKLAKSTKSFLVLNPRPRGWRWATSLTMGFLLELGGECFGPFQLIDDAMDFANEEVCRREDDREPSVAWLIRPLGQPRKVKTGGKP